MDDLDHLLAGADGLEDLFADGLGADGLDEVACDLEIDVGFEEGEADVAEGVADIGLRNLPETAEIAEDVLESRAQRVKHGGGR